MPVCLGSGDATVVIHCFELGMRNEGADDGDVVALVGSKQRWSGSSPLGTTWTDEIQDP